MAVPHGLALPLLKGVEASEPRAQPLHLTSLGNVGPELIVAIALFADEPGEVDQKHEAGDDGVDEEQAAESP
jgi:hypothetical protein